MIPCLGEPSLKGQLYIPKRTGGVFHEAILAILTNVSYIYRGLSRLSKNAQVEILFFAAWSLLKCRRLTMYTQLIVGKHPPHS